VAVAGTQVPAPEQVGAGVNVVPVQVALPQVRVAAACVHVPAPSQVPVLPHVVVTGHWPDGAATPAGISAQLPAPFRLHAWQVPQAPVPQQTPSVQKPLMHWLAAVQACPLGLRAQLLLAPLPWHVNGATQSVSEAQLVRHALLPPHLKFPLHAVGVAAAQVPLPLQ
jgi:hypothetical protein